MKSFLAYGLRIAKYLAFATLLVVAAGVSSCNLDDPTSSGGPDNVIDDDPTQRVGALTVLIERGAERLRPLRIQLFEGEGSNLRGGQEVLGLQGANVEIVEFTDVPSSVITVELEDGSSRVFKFIVNSQIQEVLATIDLGSMLAQTDRIDATFNANYVPPFDATIEFSPDLLQVPVCDAQMEFCTISFNIFTNANHDIYSSNLAVYVLHRKSEPADQFYVLTSAVETIDMNSTWRADVAIEGSIDRAGGVYEAVAVIASRNLESGRTFRRIEGIPGVVSFTRGHEVRVVSP